MQYSARPKLTEEAEAALPLFGEYIISNENEKGLIIVSIWNISINEKENINKVYNINVIRQHSKKPAYEALSNQKSAPISSAKMKAISVPYNIGNIKCNQAREYVKSIPVWNVYHAFYQ